MNTYLSNILWAFTEGYILYGIIIGILSYGFFTVIIIRLVEDTQYIDVMEDIGMPLSLGLIGAIILAFIWGFIVPFALLLGINFLIVEIIRRIVIPIYKFLKDLPIMDRRRGEDI